jgi:hypothetical protein
MSQIVRMCQSLREWASLLRDERSDESSKRTVRTEVTVERQERTVVLGNVTAESFDACPLCGQKLSPPPEPGAIVRCPQAADPQRRGT